MKADYDTTAALTKSSEEAYRAESLTATLNEIKLETILNESELSFQN